MITAGDIQYQPEQSKIMPLSSSIALLAAGDANIQAQVVYATNAEVKARIDREPLNWWKVSDVADLYAKHAMAYRVRQAEAAILAPQGLTYGTWTVGQAQLAPNVSNKIARDLADFPAPRISVVIMGVDTTGAHIYVVRRDPSGRYMEISCKDYVGFAAIGTGSGHAASELMLGGHATQNEFIETLRLLYRAKKRAEVAPGVGEATDMIIIGPELGANVVVERKILNDMEGLYQDEQKNMRDLEEHGRDSMRKYIETLTPTPQQQAPDESEGGPGPSGES